ncbi:Uronate isomerase [Planctomycetes bacterium Pan216]|uniref:Uronate isomerase n=1 Tax=Kolteria novifilia TaxID=2527975 RepID=A0A518BC99_9BACT|nr:Uronate isomerase [Planctomycetes bacterium Pan216]
MDTLAQRLYEEFVKIPLIDPHSHINPHAPVAKSLNDILGYHYYTELAHSAGLPKDKIETNQGFDQIEQLATHLGHLRNTVQYSWLVELASTFFGFEAEEVTPENARRLFDAAESTLAKSDWVETVFEKTRLEGIFLTNDFDDPLEGFDTKRYIPCLRTDELVFKLGEESVRNRFEASSGESASTIASLKKGIGALFERFTARGARACAISLPPDFAPMRPAESEASRALDKVIQGDASPEEARTLSNAVFFMLADYCEEFTLPFDLMIGVIRGVYADGVFQGQDLFDRRTSLHQYHRLFNEKKAVTFPISVLTSNQNQELVAFSWIFPNVTTNGHWWYSNIPAYIETDLRARIEAVPINKQIGYYSDAYKLEFVLPKFNMYRRCLSRVLANDYVLARGWSEERAIGLARQILRGNVETMFPGR